MKHLTADKWYAPNMMGQANAKQRKRFLAGIIVCLALIAAFSSCVFFSRLYKDKENRDKAYIATFENGEVEIVYEGYYFEFYDSAKKVTYAYAIPNVPPEETRFRLERVMADFGVMTEEVFLFFPALFFLMVTAIVLNYRSFLHPTKAMYLIRRIPDKKELHRRCLAVPGTALLIGVLLCIVLETVFYIVYLKVTLPDRIPEHITLNIWRMLI